MEYREFTGKTVEEAITNATIELGTTSDNLEYEVIEKESSGILGLGKKPARINAKIKEVSKNIDETAKEFLDKMFGAMNLVVKMDIAVNNEEKTIDVNLLGDDMGVLIGKRGQTLDSIQYLLSLVVNKGTDDYYRVKLDTENYRERRKETLENLARNVAKKAKRIRREVSFEPMNPYERRIIHSALQDDKYVTTRSEGDEPYRHVVVVPKGGNRNRNRY